MCSSIVFGVHYKYVNVIFKGGHINAHIAPYTHILCHICAKNLKIVKFGKPSCIYEKSSNFLLAFTAFLLMLASVNETNH